MIIDPIDTSPISTEVAPVAPSSATILFIDDNAELRDYIGNELRSYFRVRTAREGSEGLKLARQYLPDLIVTDVIMPGMDGFTFCEQLRADEQLRHIPVIMLTAKGAFEDQVAGLEHGADLYLQKPFDINLLRLQISRLLKSRQTLYNKYSTARGTAVPSTVVSDREFMQLLMDYVERNMSQSDLSVDTLAAVAHLSRSQLYRRIKTLTKLTANQFIRQTRLVRAQKLILEGRHSISEIVFLVGFSSGSYFAKCYKAHFGHLPSEEA
jgi:DNA-binding response OmpR family regulator